MKNDTHELLNDLLAQWHRWSDGFQPVASHGTSAMFCDVRSSRQWDNAGDVADAVCHNTEMKALDFHIMELKPDYRTAIGINARNLVTGRSVWTSARLPDDIEKRAEILRDARSELLRRLGM